MHEKQIYDIFLFENSSILCSDKPNILEQDTQKHCLKWSGNGLFCPDDDEKTLFSTMHCTSWNNQVQPSTINFYYIKTSETLVKFVSSRGTTHPQWKCKTNEGTLTITKLRRTVFWIKAPPHPLLKFTRSIFPLERSPLSLIAAHTQLD